MEKLLKSLSDKYHLAKDVMRKNDPSNYFLLHTPHDLWCKEETHSKCWAQGTRARIVLKACGRFLYLITNEPLDFCDVKAKPKLGDIVKYIAMNYEDINNENYQFLMGIKDKLEEFGFGDKKKEKK